MKKSVVVAIGIGAIALIYLMGKSGAGKKLKISLYKLRAKTRGFNIPDVFLDFKIINPTNQNLNIRSIVGSLNVNDNPFSTISQLQAVEIPANQEIIYSVKVQTTVTDAIQTVWALLKNKQKLKITFDGTVNSEGFLIPVQQTIFG